MPLLAIALLLAQPSVSQPPAAFPIEILAKAEDREALLGLLEDLGRDPKTAESGLYAVSCVTAWRGNPDQTEACIRSRLPVDRPAVVINAYGGSSPDGGTIVTCVGAGGSGEMILMRPLRPGSRGGVERCLIAAAAGAASAPHGRYGLRFTGSLTIADAEQARAAAANVLTIAADHVGHPRGISGLCLVQGRVIGVVRGAGLTPRGTIALSVPCIAGPSDAGPRRIRSEELSEGTFADVFLSERMELLDYRRRRP